MLLCLCGIVSADDYRSDPRLLKPIGLHLKIVPLSVCVKEFSDQTGVGIYVAPNIAERKVTVIFKDRPASEAMAMLATTMFCEWSNESGGYRLEMPREVLNEEIGLLAAEDTVLKERLNAVIQQIVAVAARPKEELIQERDLMTAQLDQLRYSRSAEGQKQYQQLRKDYSKFNWLNWWEIGFALRNAPSALDTLASGATVFASTDRGQAALPLPRSSIPTFTTNVMVVGDDGKPHMEQRTPTGALAAIRCNPVNGDLETRTMATGLGTGASGMNSNRTRLLDTGDAENKLYNLPLRKRLRKWAATLDTQVLAIKLGAPSSTPKSAGFMAQAYSLAEHLEYLADSANVPVIADAFRLAASTESYMGGSTVGDYLRQLREQSFIGVNSATMRTEKGWIMFRHPRFWRQINAEIPERAYAPMERKVAAGKRLDLDDYASFAQGLTPWQSRVFPYRPPLTRFPRLPLVNAMPALRLWESLRSDQRQAAYAAGLPLAGMGGTQVDLYREAVSELLWISHVNESFFPVLVGSASRDNLGLFLQDSGNGVQTMGGMGQEGYGASAPTQVTMADIERMRTGAYSFIFGDSLNSGAVYYVQLSPRE